MNIERRKISDNVELLIGRFPDDEESMLQNFSTLQEVLRAELSFVSNRQRKIEILGTHLLLKFFFNEEKRIYHEDNGKPYVDDRNLKISISHSSHEEVVVAIIIGKANSLGIDIERKRPTLFRVNHKFLSEKEQKQIFQMPTCCQLDLLALYWCAKETVYKMMPVSLPNFVDEIIVDPFEMSESGKMTVWADMRGEKKKLMLEYELTDEYALTYSVI